MFPVFVLVSSVEVCSLERLPKPLMLQIDVGILRKQACLSLLSVWAVCSLYRTLYSSACVQRGEVAMHSFFCFRLLTQCLPAFRTRPEENSLGSVPRLQWVSWEDGARVGVGLAPGTVTSVCLLGASGCPLVGWLLGSPVLLQLSEASNPLTIL